MQFLLKNGKKGKKTFWYSLLKKFHGRAKGGHRTVALPLNTPLFRQDIMVLKTLIYP